MTTIDSSTDDVGSETAEAFARDHPNLVKLGRAGWIAKGIVYALTGVLALVVASQSSGAASGVSGKEASQSGAIATIADQPAGVALLVVITLGLALYVLWRMVTIILPAENNAKTWLTRAGYLISVVSYTALGWSALSFARNPGTSEGGEDAKVERYTRTLLEATAGRSLVFVVGIGLIAVGAFFLYKGYAATFESDLNPGRVGPLSHQGLVTMGRIGWAGRGVMMGLIGFFLLRAAINFDADDAKGLDGSLRTLSGSAVGTVLIAVVAVALVTYGAFCAFSAPRRKLIGAD